MSGADKRASLQQQISEKYPDLTVTNENGQIYIRGSFAVEHDGQVLDRYQIQIEWSDSDTEAPLLWETGGRIPKTTDRHVSPNGKACPFVPEEWLLRARDARTVIDYLNGPVHDYFLWQALVDHGIPPKWGQRSHGTKGLLEAYAEMVGMTGERQVRLCLEFLSKKRIKGHWLCPCQSGLVVRKCHAEHLRRLEKRIPRRVAALALKRLETPTMR